MKSKRTAIMPQPSLRLFRLAALAATASCISLVLCIGPAESQTESAQGTSSGDQKSFTGNDAAQINLPDQSASIAPGAESKQSRLIDGGVEQRETITLPAVQTSKNMTLPKLMLEVPKLETVPPVPRFLKAGATFDEKKETLPAEANIWYEIPSFFAGHWQSAEKTITSSVNFVTGHKDFNVRTEEFISELHQGFQQDKTGAYWHFQNTPFLGHSTGPNDVVRYSYVQLIEPISSTPDRFVRRCILTKADVNSAQTVQTSTQVELIQSYSPLGPDTIREDTAARQLGPDGKAIWQNTATVVFTKTSPYHPIDHYKGKDMKALFRDYLISHDMSDRVPQ